MAAAKLSGRYGTAFRSQWMQCEELLDKTRFLSGACVIPTAQKIVMRYDPVPRRSELTEEVVPESKSLGVSIIIVSWNTRNILRSCLGSVYGQAGNVSFEILVIDNASSDGSADMVAAEFPQVHLIRNTENVGFAAANNQGIAVSKARYVLLLNSDSVVLGGAQR